MLQVEGPCLSEDILFHYKIMPKTLFILTPFCQDAKYMALSHEELAAKFLQSEICIHSCTCTVWKYFPNEVLGCPDTLCRRRGGDSWPSSKRLCGQYTEVCRRHIVGT